VSFDVFASTVSMLAIIPLGYVAVQSMREARNLRRIQEELTALVVDTKEISEEVHRLQRELRVEQDAAKVGIDETQRTVEHATEVIEQTAEKVTEVASGTQALRPRHRTRGHAPRSNRRATATGASPAATAPPDESPGPARSRRSRLDQLVTLGRTSGDCGA
jgi:low affinity Fe/Cu permease